MKKIFLPFLLLGSTIPIYAGMPTARLGYLTTLRLETISFFLFIFLLASWFVKILWNNTLVDLFNFPKITYKRTLVLMILWGMLFNLILTMISGARELMTPGAWTPKGVTYTLTNDAYTKEHMVGLRKKHIENLRSALWSYAKENNNSFPPHNYDASISDELWTTIHESKIRYHYIEMATIDKKDSILLFEPAVFGNTRFVLFCDGTIKTLSTKEIDNIITENYEALKEIQNEIK